MVRVVLETPKTKTKRNLSGRETFVYIPHKINRKKKCKYCKRWRKNLKFHSFFTNHHIQCYMESLAKRKKAGVIGRRRSNIKPIIKKRKRRLNKLF